MPGLMVDIQRVMEGSGGISFRFPPESVVAALGMPAPAPRLVGDMIGTAEKESGGWKVHLQLPIRYEGSCDRCLEPTIREETISVSERFVLESTDREPDAYTFHEHTLDLADMVRDILVLAEPIRDVCREDCRGLCPTCGANRNLARCECPEPVENNPFEKLRALKNSME